MRGKGRRWKREARLASDRPTTARERLERRWFKRCQRDDRLAPLVTGDGLAHEPFHRWLPFKQAFAPELVRRFLTEAPPAGRPETLPLLDPFSGVGTFAVECARQGFEARGVEAIPSLVFIAAAKSTPVLPEMPDLFGATSWQQMADRLTEPIHRAALICAVARQYTSRGRLNRNAPPLTEVLAAVLEMIGDDLRAPLPAPARFDRGDARNLFSLKDGSVGGILTSPPYLSRHDYTLVTRPHEMVYRYWYEGRDLAERRRDQVRAHPRAYQQAWSERIPPAVTEACEQLQQVNEPKVAGVVRSYFEDTFVALRECARVLAEGSACWIVVGGARLKDVYIPSDTILADFAETCGFEVQEIRVARRLIPAGRKFGTLENVAPRESMLVMHRRADRTTNPLAGR